MKVPDAHSPRDHPRIAYLVNQYPSPSLVFVRREIEALERNGHAVERLAIRRWADQLVDPRDRSEQSRTTYLLDLGVWAIVGATLVMSICRPRRLAQAFRLAWRAGRRSDRGRLRNLIYLTEACLLARLAKQRSIDWIHAHFGTNSTTVAMLCRTLGGPPYSFTCHGPEEFDRPEALHLGEKIARADLVIGVSQFGRSQLCRWSPHDHWHKLEVVHCGVDPSYLRLRPSPPPPSRRLVSIGRLHEQKGTLLLVEAAHRVRQRLGPFELILVGDGPMRPEVEQLVAQYQLQETIQLVGWQTHEQIQAWLHRSRALVLPSFAEGLPVVIMESLASYRPVITTYIAGIPELVRPESNGWLIPAGDVDALVEAMQAALQAPVEQLAEMGRCGAAAVARQHNIDTEAQRLLALISQRFGAK